MLDFGEYTPRRPSPAAQLERVRELRKRVEEAQAELEELLRQEEQR